MSKCPFKVGDRILVWSGEEEVINGFDTDGNPTLRHYHGVTWGPHHWESWTLVGDEELQEAPQGAAIRAECAALAEMLVEKNRKYGDSALNPVRVFSKASPEEQILVRMDDKLSRLRSAQGDEDEDVIQDLLGYLILYRIAQKQRQQG